MLSAENYKLANFFSSNTGSRESHDLNPLTDQSCENYKRQGMLLATVSGQVLTDPQYRWGPKYLFPGLHPSFKGVWQPQLCCMYIQH